jgi:peptide/nickel transport system substrate-binding protein
MLVVWLALLALVAAGCGGGGDAEGGQDAGVAEATGDDTSTGGSGDGAITVALPDEPASLDPCDATYTENNRILTGNVTESLVDRDPETGELLPALATEWTQVDGSTYEFTIREGVTFSDGSPLDAEAVAEAINRSFEPDLNCGIKGFIFNDEDLTATASGDNVVTVQASQEDPILPLRLSFLQIGGTPGTERVDEPIGTGPYVLEEWNRGQSVVLSRNDSYWGDSPEIAEVEYIFRPESSVRANMVQTGEADLAIAIAPQDLDQDLSETFTLAETLFLRLDTFAEPLDDVRVRRAVNHAVDRQGLIDSLLGGTAEPASQIILQNVDGYNENIEVPEYDPEEAQRLLEEAEADGVDLSTEITLYGRQGFYANSEQVMEAVAEMLRAVGLNVKVEQLETATWLDEVLRKPFPEDRVAITENVHGNNAGDAIFTVVTKFSSEGDESTLNDPRVDELIEQASVAEGEQRTELFEELFAYLHEEVVPVAPIAHLSGALMTSDRLEYTPNLHSNDILRIADMSLE